MLTFESAKIGDRVRYLRQGARQVDPRVPSKVAGEVIRKKNGWVWVRFKSERGEFDRQFLPKNLLPEAAYYEQ
jgi:uncharacterized protein YgiM (DUF1202 family)